MNGCDMAKRQYVGKLLAYAWMRGRFGSTNGTEKVKAADQTPVVLPQGAAELARVLCAKHGADQVVLRFDQGAVQYRNSNGNKVKPSAMSRHLAAELA